MLWSARECTLPFPRADLRVNTRSHTVSRARIVVLSPPSLTRDVRGKSIFSNGFLCCLKGQAGAVGLQTAACAYQTKETTNCSLGEYLFVAHRIHTLGRRFFFRCFSCAFWIDVPLGDNTRYLLYIEFVLSVVIVTRNMCLDWFAVYQNRMEIFSVLAPDNRF